MDCNPTASSLTTSIFPVRYRAFSGVHFHMSLVIKQALFIYTEDCQDCLDSFSTFFDIFRTCEMFLGDLLNFCKYTKWTEEPSYNAPNCQTIKTRDIVFE